MSSLAEQLSILFKTVVPKSKSVSNPLPNPAAPSIPSRETTSGESTMTDKVGKQYLVPIRLEDDCCDYTCREVIGYEYFHGQVNLFNYNTQRIEAMTKADFDKYAKPYLRPKE